jgi:hypothetical protein
MIHISFSFAGVNEKATYSSAPYARAGSTTRTFENSKAGVKRETLMTFNFLCVALSVTPARDRTYPATQSRMTSATDYIALAVSQGRVE